MTVCPKCEYQRRPVDTAPAYECPHCGVIYEKAVPRQAVRSPDAVSRAAPVEQVIASQKFAEQSAEPGPKAHWIDGNRNVVLVASIAASLAVGYVAGREHLKYELRSAFADAAQGIKRTLDGEVPPAPTKPKATAAKDQPIAPKLIRKGFQEGEYGRNAITFTVDFSNLTGKPVRAFDGVLVFTDLLGNEIYGAKLAINDAIDAASTYSWDGKLDYNQFMADHERLRNTPVENIKIVLRTKKVLFGDGQVKEYEQ